jgi:alkylhydroperoxidase family enzyme
MCGRAPRSYRLRMTTAATGFLGPVPETDDVRRLRDRDLERFGYVLNLSGVWGHLPSLHTGLFALADEAARAASLTVRLRGVLVVACAAAVEDSYCSLAWGRKLAEEAGEDVAAAVIRGDDEGLEPAEHALAAWARAITRDPNATEARDLEPLRAAGYDDAQLLAITVFVTLRRAFATVNDALGALPDAALTEHGPPAVREAVTYGRRNPGQNP